MVAAAWPVGVHRIQPGDSGSVTVRFMTTAEAPELRHTGPTRDLDLDRRAGPAPCRPGCRVPSRVSNSRAGRDRREAVAGGRGEVAEHVDEAVRGAGRVEDLDRAVAADAHHHQVRHRTPGTGIEVRRERPRRADRDRR